MSDFTDFLESEIADSIFNNSSYSTQLDGPHIALWTTSPAESPNGSNEVSGGSYSRVSTTSSDWTSTTDGDAQGYENSTAIDFGELDSSTSTTVEGVVVVDDANGNYLYANGDVSETVDAGNEFKINAGDATFTVD